VTAEKIKRIIKKEDYSKELIKHKQLNEQNKTNQQYQPNKRTKDIVSCADGVENVRVNDRVVYFDDADYLYGKLIFLGYTNQFDDEIYAVVETVNKFIFNLTKILCI